MIISDLEHLEVVAEETSIVGGTARRPAKKRPPARPGFAFADAGAFANGPNPVALTQTTTIVTENSAVSGSTSQSSVGLPIHP